MMQATVICTAATTAWAKRGSGPGCSGEWASTLQKRSACDINGQLSPLTTPLFFPHHVQLSAGLYTKQSWPTIPSK